MICQHGQDKLESFLEHLNNMHDPIKFTMEIGQNGQLPFLGVLVEMTSVYQKHTHMDQYLQYNSHHHPRVKTGIISCLRQRACNICDEDKLGPELEHLQETFQVNGYPTKLVRTPTRTRRHGDSPGDREKPKKLFIPY